MCVPSRVALLTGLQPHRLPTQENRFALREGFWTLAHELRRAGYETALIGKMHFAPVHAQHGFDTMRLCEHLSAQGLGELSRQRGDEVDDYHDWLSEQGLTDWRGEEHARLSVPPQTSIRPDGSSDEAIEFLERRDRSRPLFLVVSFPHPHAPYNPPEPYRSMYDPSDSRLPTDAFDVNEKLPFAFQMALRKARTCAAAADEAVLARVPRDGTAARSATSTTRIGCGARRASTWIRRWWASPPTTATMPATAASSGRRRGSPSTTWPACRSSSPGPASQAAGTSRASCRAATSRSTCLDFAGVKAPQGIDFDTRSLRPLLCDEAAAEDIDRPVFTATTMGWPMVRRGRYKLVMNDDAKSKALFDLEADPGERVNLRRDPAYQDQVLCAPRPLARGARPARRGPFGRGRGRGLTLAPYGGGQIPSAPPAGEVAVTDRLAFMCNGRNVEVDVEAGESLLSVLREQLGLMSVKDGCAPQGQCGCCTVLVDGDARVSCVTAAARVEGRSITTIEGLDPAVRDRCAAGFVDSGGSQCGFCTPGIIMRAPRRRGGLRSTRHSPRTSAGAPDG